MGYHEDGVFVERGALKRIVKTVDHASSATNAPISFIWNTLNPTEAVRTDRKAGHPKALENQGELQAAGSDFRP